jgi:hypothetical protein
MGSFLQNDAAELRSSAADLKFLQQLPASSFRNFKSKAALPK